MRLCRLPVQVLVLAVVFAVFHPCHARAEDPPDSIDLDAWHAPLGVEEGDDEGIRPRFVLGLYPGVSGVVGAPNTFSSQGNIYLSFGRPAGYSAYVGYGREYGSPSDAEIYTLGWGGVRDLPVASRQRGFYGKFVRYRRWNHGVHGTHHGLSFGAEHGVGYFSVMTEFGAARSDRSHWLVTAQLSIKVALPIRIALGRSDEGTR